MRCRLRAHGLPTEDADDAPAGLVEAMRPDMAGTWLPVALANILQALWAAQGAAPPKTRDIWESWGLRVLAREADAERDAETERVIESLGG